MLRIGYVRLRDAHDDAPVLKAAGCQVVRTEEPGVGGHTLNSILDFIGAGDQLVVARLDRLSLSSRGLLDALERLDARDASLRVLEPPLSSQGEQGRTLRAVLEAVADIDPAGAGRRRRPAAAAHEIFALQRAGVGPVEIARRLGVSRMTVWRKLKAVETAQA
jgi:DNA invertase Pin-like site-specific DNA recombinase